jgi:hypothetical protein
MSRNTTNSMPTITTHKLLKNKELFETCTEIAEVKRMGMRESIIKIKEK